MKMAETIRIEIPVEVVDETSEGITQTINGLQKLNKALQQTNNKTTQYEKSSQKTQKTLASWARQKYEVLLSVKDKVSPILKTIGSGLKSFGSKTFSVTMKAVDLITAPVRGILNILKNPLFQAGAVLGVSFGIKDTIDTYKNFEAAMSKVQAVSGATSSELAKLTDKAKEMGSTTKFTAAQSAEAFNYMAMAGWKPEQMLDGIEDILNLAAASGEDLGTTSDIVTDAMTAFRLEASEATHFADVLARASSSSNTNVSMMGETFKYVGAMAGTLGYSIKDVSIMIGLMANSGIKASQAGTELNSIFTRLATNTNGATDAIKELGIDFFDSSGEARDLIQVVNELREATADYTDEQKSNIANTIAGTRAQAGLLAILNASEDDYKDLTEAIYNADGAAQQMADTMLDNLEGSIIKLQSALDGVKISFGKRLSPYVRGIANWLTDLMPDIEDGLDRLMDWVDKKIERMKRKFNEIVDTKEWQNADFFGKVHILWDEFIAQPFTEWWNTTGKATFANIAKDIGKGIGSGLKFGLMTLLGIDISETIDEGVSIGASFAKGFSQGFDAGAVMDKLGEGLKNLFSNASKLLPGGESAGLSSLFSALLLGKIARPFISLGKGAASVGKGLFGKNAETGTSLVGSFLGSATKGTGVMGKMASLGSKLTSTSIGGFSGLLGSQAAGMSGAGLIASGAGAVTGGVVAGASLINAGIDAYKALTSDNKEEAKTHGLSTGIEVGATGVGAAIGTLVLPGVGTLIGAGIGGIAGWLAGDAIKKDYQANVQEMQAMSDKVQAVYAATGITIDKNSKFANKALKDALQDTQLSAEEFVKMFQESSADIMNKAFGNIKLSFTEIKKMAEEITFKDMKQSLDEFNAAVVKTESSLEALKSSVVDIKRENWKVSLGIELSEIERDNYKQTVDTFVKNARLYIENNHYEATVALKLLMGKDADTANLDSMYNDFIEQIDSISKQLSNSIEIALSDGVITLDESKEIINLQQQISDITNKLTEAQNEAELEAIGIQFKASGAELTPETFASLQEQLNVYKKSAEEMNKKAMIESLKNVNLLLSEGAITSEEAEEQKKEIEKAYDLKMSISDSNVTSFNLQTIADAFGSRLDGILPDLEGTIAEKLQVAFKNAMLKRPDVSAWDENFIKDMFDLGGLDKNTLTNIQSILKTTAESVPQTVKEQILQSYKKSVPTTDEIMEAIDWDNFNTKMFEDIVGKQQHLIEPGSNWSILDPILDGLSGENLDIAMRNSAQQIHDALEKNLDPSVVSDFRNTYMSGNLDKMMEDSIKDDSDNMMSWYKGYKPIPDEFYEKVTGEWKKTGAALGEYLNEGASSSISGYSSILKTALQTALNIATMSPFSVNPTVNITPKYNITSLPEDTTTVSSGQHKATGGYVSGKQLSWVGEEGPEAIIPLVPGRRNRAMSLYEEVGKILGVGAYAAGGIVGSSYVVKNMGDYHLLNEAIKDAPIGYNKVIEDSTEDSNSTTTPITQQSGNNNIEVHIQMSPEFVINHLNTQSEDEMMVIIRKGMMTMADELGGEIAQRIEAVFSNMPIVKEA